MADYKAFADAVKALGDGVEKLAKRMDASSESEDVRSMLANVNERRKKMKLPPLRGERWKDLMHSRKELEAFMRETAGKRADSINRYQPLLRPPSRSTLPSGVSWDYVELPRDNFNINRPDLPRGKTSFGIIKTDRPLTPDECDRFDLRSV